MPIEQARAFLARVANDGELRAIIDALARRNDVAAAFEEGLSLAKSSGFHFTAAEWKQAITERTAAANELSDNQLESVSGGLGDLRLSGPSRLEMESFSLNGPGPVAWGK